MRNYNLFCLSFNVYTGGGGWLLVSQYACLLELIANRCCSRLLGQIVFVQHPQIPPLYCNYGERALVTNFGGDSAFSVVTNSLNKASTLGHDDLRFRSSTNMDGSPHSSVCRI